LEKTNTPTQALANKLWLKTADLVALEGKDYYKAIELYEKVSKTSIQNNLMRWSVKEYLLKAGICQLCTGDQVGVNTALDRYRDLDPSFVQQREHQLLVDLTQAVQDGDQEVFADKACSRSNFEEKTRLTSVAVPIRPTEQAGQVEDNSATADQGHH
jgi:hypothetical protein